MPVTYYRMMAMFAGTETGRRTMLDLRMGQYGTQMARISEELR
jgi:hypothetical protein